MEKPVKQNELIVTTIYTTDPFAYVFAEKM